MSPAHLAWLAAFWTAVALYRGGRPVRFVAGLAAAAAAAHLGQALLHPGVARPFDPGTGASVLFVPIGLLIFAPTPAAFATLPLALAVARLGCLAAGCCHGPEGEPTPLLEMAAGLALHATVSRLPESRRVAGVLVGVGLVRLAAEPWRAASPLGPSIVSPAWLAAAWVALGLAYGSTTRQPTFWSVRAAHSASARARSASGPPRTR